jgi:hypothetical protein
MKTLIFSLFSFILLPLMAQDQTGIIYPGNAFTNQTTDTLFYLPKQKIETLMYREEISNALIQCLNARNVESDSLLSLKTREANGWYSRLIEADKLLEESEVVRIQEKHKAGNKMRIWFGIGAVAGLVIGVVL